MVDTMNPWGNITADDLVYTNPPRDFWDDLDPEEQSSWVTKHKDDLMGLMNLEIQANGKGDNRRPAEVDRTTYDANWQAVFGDKRKHVCREYVFDKDGNERCYFCNEPKKDVPW